MAEHRGVIKLTDVREPVAHLALRMEESLRAHDEDRGRAGWLDGSYLETLEYLERRLAGECAELSLAGECAELSLATWPAFSRENVVQVWKEASDVANMAMMIADRYHREAMQRGLA